MRFGEEEKLELCRKEDNEKRLRVNGNDRSNHRHSEQLWHVRNMQLSLVNEGYVSLHGNRREEQESC